VRATEQTLGDVVDAATPSESNQFVRDLDAALGTAYSESGIWMHSGGTVGSVVGDSAVASCAGRQRSVSKVVGVLSLAPFMSSLDLFVVNLAFLYIARDYRGTSLSSLSWVRNAYAVVFATVLVSAGRWADRMGRLRVFLAGVVVFSGGSVACGLASGVGWLVAARVVQAVGAGFMVPASPSLLLATVSDSLRPRAIGTWAALGVWGRPLPRCSREFWSRRTGGGSFGSTCRSGW
jgi:hypothetical protein